MATMMFCISFSQTWTGICNCKAKTIYTSSYSCLFEPLPFYLIVLLVNFIEQKCDFFCFLFLFFVATLYGRKCLYMLNCSWDDLWTGGLWSIKLMVSSSIHSHLWCILTTVLHLLLVTWRSRAYSKLYCFLIYWYFLYIFQLYFSSELWLECPYYCEGIHKIFLSFKTILYAFPYHFVLGLFLPMVQLQHKMCRVWSNYNTDLR